MDAGSVPNFGGGGGGSPSHVKGSLWNKNRGPRDRTLVPALNQSWSSQNCHGRTKDYFHFARHVKNSKWWMRVNYDQNGLTTLSLEGQRRLHDGKVDSQDSTGRSCNFSGGGEGRKLCMVLLESAGGPRESKGGTRERKGGEQRGTCSCYEGPRGDNECNRLFSEQVSSNGVKYA